MFLYTYQIDKLKYCICLDAIYILEAAIYLEVLIEFLIGQFVYAKNF